MKKFFYALSILFFITLSIQAAPGLISAVENIGPGFIQNKGQFLNEHDQVRNDILYVYRTHDFRLILRNSGFSYELYYSVPSNPGNYESGYVAPESDDEDDEVEDAPEHQLFSRTDVDFVKAQKDFSVEGLNPLPYYFNYYTQAVPINKVSVYSKICYRNVYHNVDLVFYFLEGGSSGRTVKYDWIIHPGGNAADISLMYRGAKQMKLQTDGTLFLGNDLGWVTEGKPTVTIAANPLPSDVGYKLTGNKLAFVNVKADNHQDVVIDPVVSWGLYLGGVKKDFPDEIALDDSEHVYICGRTTSQILYYNSLPVDSTGPDNKNDAFLAKFDKNGVLIWITYYGGLGDEKPFAMCLDPKTQEIFMAGKTSSAEAIAFNCVNDPMNFKMDGTYAGNFDGFLAKFTTSGQVIRSTYVGGTAFDYLLGVCCYLGPDGQEWVYACGSGEGPNGIVVPSYPNVEQFVYSGGDKDHGDVLVFKFTADLTQRVWGSYYGKQGGQERAHELITDNMGNIYVVGTMSEDYGGQSKGDQIYQPDKGGVADAFLSRWTPDGKMPWLTYFGGPDYDRGRDVQTDDQGNIYIAGKTTAARFYPSAFASSLDVVKSTTPIDSDLDGYVAKFNPNGGLIWSSYFGGTNYEDIRGLCVNPSGSPIYVCGYTTSNDLPTTDDAYHKTNSQGDFYFAKLNYNATKILYCTYYGGKGNEGALPNKFPDWYNGVMAVSYNSGDIFFSSGTTSNCDIDPNCKCSEGCTSGGYGDFADGDYDAFVAKFTDPCGSDDDPFEPNDVINTAINKTPPVAYTIATPVVVNGTLRPDISDNVDFYQLPIPDHSLPLTITLTQPAGVDYTLDLLDSNGNVLASGGPQDIINIALATAGQYFIRIGSTSNIAPPDGGCYSYKIETGIADIDGDGFSLAHNDCDDSNPNINPNATETCNGIDDNCNGMVDEAVRVYTFTDDVNGAPSMVSAHATAANLAVVNTAKTAASSCPTGFSAKNFPAVTTYSSSLPAVEFVITPASGYHIEATSFSVDLRRNSTGPALIRFAYSTDGGTNWIDEGIDHSLLNASCGIMTSFNWDFPDFLSLQPLKFRIYAFNASATGGVLQILNIGFNGKVCTAILDFDNDGYNAAVDCNENNAAIHPNAIELCNAVDDNCNSQIDEGLKVTLYADSDSDSYGNLALPFIACPGTKGYAANSTDCNDANTTIHPNAAETCNGIDDDCDAIIDERVEVYNYLDEKTGIPLSVTGNSTGSNLIQVNGAIAVMGACPTGFNSQNFPTETNFNTALPAIEFTITPNASYLLQPISFSADMRRSTSGPASVRFAYSTDSGTTWIDEGINHTLLNSACGATITALWDFADFTTTKQLKFRIYGFNASATSGVLQLLNVKLTGSVCSSVLDADNDTYNASVDCNDYNAAVHPGATEVCNGIDDNCDSQIDEGVKLTFYADADNDTYGNAASTAIACVAPAGYVSINTDCNDANGAIHPNAAEICNNIDDDCDTVIDDGASATFYADADHDGYGDPAMFIITCPAPLGYVSNNTDCNDANGAIHPNASETCNGLDDDCDSQTDEGVQITFYADGDNDAYGNPNATILACTVPTGYVSNNTDCNDVNATVHPNASETCNAIDDNCNGTIDEAIQVYRYTDNLTGVPFSLAANASGTNLTNVNNAGLAIGSAACPTGYSAKNFTAATVFSTTLPAVEITITPGNGFQLEAGTFAADLRRNATGPAFARFAYSIDGGANWISEGSDHSLANTTCGKMTTVTWDFADFITTQPLKFRIYGFSASSSSGILQLLNVNFNGKVCAVGADIDLDGYSASVDCNDNNASVHPNATEVCNGIDDDCDSQVDEGVLLTFYADGDHDGFGNLNITTLACSAPAGYVSNNTDCNDADTFIHPTQPEACNGIDDNCDTQIDEGVKSTFYADADSDTYGNPSLTTLACTQPAGYVSDNTDCNDGIKAIHPNVVETCNGVDDNCDTQIDEGVKITFYADADNDSYGNQQVTLLACTPPVGYVSNGTDCNDASGSIHPNASETCNNIDDNCDTQVDENAKTTFYIDNDNDGYGNSNVTTLACSLPAGYAANSTDCNDANIGIHPNASETCNSIDDDCNGITDEPIAAYHYTDDISGIPASISINSTGTNLTRVNGATSSTTCTTGFSSKGFTNTSNYSTTLPAIEISINPSVGYQLGASAFSAALRRSGGGPSKVRFAYSLDGGNNWIDQGTNQSVPSADCGVTTNFTWDFSDFTTTQSLKFRIYGFNASSTTGLLQVLNVNFTGNVCASLTDGDGDGYITANDCNDANAAVHPNATEICNGIDDNCDSQIDEGVKSTFYADSDQDSFGNPAISSIGCTAPLGYVSNGLDCNDSNGNIYPTKAEICNGIDDNCNTQIDEGVKSTFFADTDNDGYGNALVSTIACTAPAGYVSNNTDCNDAITTIHPNAPEACNGIDDNCDTVVDNGTVTLYYADGDNDGYGNPAVSVLACPAPQGYVSNNSDCNDADPGIHPGVSETCNSIDDNCDSQIDEGVQTTFYADADLDSYGNPNVTLLACALPAGYVAVNTDCNDANAAIHPNTIEVCNNIDDNCNGVTDESTVIYNYTDNTSGIPLSVAAHATGTNLTRVNGAGAASGAQLCPTGLSSKNFTSAIDFSTSLPAIEFTITPASGYQIRATSFSAQLRRSSNGPALARFAYSIDGGTNWIDEGTNHSLANTPCGTMSNALWDFADLSTTQPVKFRIYGFNGANTTGTFQQLNIILNGNICPTDAIIDADNDGYDSFTDCNDANAQIHPNATEICNGIDDDCDTQIDEGVKLTFYADADNDTYGNLLVTTLACSTPVGYVSNSTDCNDGNVNIHPNATETCNGIDDNCDTQIDEGVKLTFYADADHDTYGNLNVTTLACSSPVGYVSNSTDCNDANASIHPNATETCNTIDDNCDTQIDEGVKSTFYADADNDTYGNLNATTLACSAPAGYVSNNTDCNDGNAAVHPNAPETCNNIDDNCNGVTDDPTVIYNYTDNTSGVPLAVGAHATGSNLTRVNGAGPSSGSSLCPTGLSSKNFTSATTFSTSLPAIEFTITPNSGYKIQANSFSAELRRSANGPATVRFAYSLDGGTNWIDEGLDHSLANSNCGIMTPMSWDFTDFSTLQPLKFRIYGFNGNVTGTFQQLNIILNGNVCITDAVIDADNDGYDSFTDCNDGNPQIHPGATEVCNGVDDNCNTQIDEGVKSTFYADADNDSYGNLNVTALACSAPAGFVSNSTDCNDANSTIHPNVVETCNGIDDNCDTQVDEGVKSTFYADADNDAYGNLSMPTLACSQPVGFVSNSTDCNDANVNIHPGVNETCNGLDDNCNTQIDEGVQSTFYADADNDTYGNLNVTTLACSAPANYVSNSTDCNDANAAVHPNATETCNGIDDNCNGTIDETILIFNYTDNTSGVPLAVAANATGSNLTRVNGATATTGASICPTGFSSEKFTSATLYSSSLPAIEFTMTPAMGYQVTATSFSADLRRSGKGPASARFAYSIDGGSNWIDEGINHTLDNNSACGVMITFSWDFADFSTTQPLKFRIYGFNAGATTGTFQQLNINLTGKVCTAAVADVDQDGYNNTVDCNDNNPLIHPNATEICNGVDDDCDFQIDEGVKLTFYADADNDTYGNQNVPILACAASAGIVSNNTDCNDANNAVHPGVADICNSIDDNCNTVIDENAFVAIISPSGPITLCSGATVVLNANTGTGLTYQWLKNNKNISGATNSAFTADKAASYTVKENNAFSCSSTSAITSTLQGTTPNATITPLGNLDICGTGSVVLQANSGAGLTYQWQKGNVAISGATNQNYTASNPATYKVTVTSSDGCSKGSTGVKVTKSCKGGEALTETTSPILKIYPNPTDRKFTIDLQLPTGENRPATVEIINQFGKMVYTEKLSIIDGEIREEISLDHSVVDGIYLVRVISNDKIYPAQVILQK